MKDIQKVHLIEVKYLGATNTQGSRVKITSLRFKDSVVIPFNYIYTTIDEMFEAWLREVGSDLGIVSKGYNEQNGTYIFGVEVFEPMKNIKKGGVLV